MIGRAGAWFAGALAVSAAVPASASAHGLVARDDLPIPQWLFGWAAAVVLVLSFVALAVLWRRPLLEDARARALFDVPAWVEVICGAVGVALFALVVYSGLAGTQTSTANLAPTFVYVLFWVGLAPVSALFGDVFRAFNPWRAVARASAWAAARTMRQPLPKPLPYPERLGRWPAVVGLLAFAWLELVSSDATSPQLIAILALVYAAAQLVGMALYGIDRWGDRGDAFGVYFNLFARLAPLQRRGSKLYLVRPLSRVTGLLSVPGTLALLFVMIGSTSFDGASGGEAWSAAAPELQSALERLGLGQMLALEVTFTIGLIASILLIAGLYRLGVSGMRTVGHAGTSDLAGRFAHALVPIALAYVLAHYFSLLVFQGQSAGYLFSDPLGRGADLLGLASTTIDYGLISANGIWYVQVAALVIGHVAGLVLAHDRALTTYPTTELATRSQYWMLVVMVGYTSLGLWLLSSG